MHMLRRIVLFCSIDVALASSMLRSEIKVGSEACVHMAGVYEFYSEVIFQMSYELGCVKKHC